MTAIATTQGEIATRRSKLTYHDSLKAAEGWLREQGFFKEGDRWVKENPPRSFDSSCEPFQYEKGKYLCEVRTERPGGTLTTLTEQEEIAALKARIAELEKLLAGEVYRKEFFGPNLECRFCKTVKGNGHNVNCRIGQILMGTYKGD